MLRMSKLTDYGTVVLAWLAAAESGLHTAPDVAEHTGLAEPTVRKLLKTLVRAGLVESVRGAAGGYQLARPAERITAAEILDALEGPVAITECSSDHSNCDLESHCGMSSKWQGINRSIREALHTISLADMASRAPLPPLEIPLRRMPARRGGDGNPERT